MCTADLRGLVPEVLSRTRRVILLEESADPAGRRSSLAHALAHLDLGHGATLAGFFENREEAQADRLAAQRLIGVEQLAAVLRWTRDSAAVAEELGVDAAMVHARYRCLLPAERRRLAALAASGVG